MGEAYIQDNPPDNWTEFYNNVINTPPGSSVYDLGITSTAVPCLDKLRY